MRGRNYYVLLIIGLLYCVSAACTSVRAGGIRSENVQVPLTVVFSGGQCFCKQNALQIELINKQPELDAFFKQNSKRTIGPSKSERRDIDFSKNAVVALWMGRKPTAGYRLTLEKNTAEISDHKAHVRVNLEEPGADAVLAQMITSPCLVLALPKGPYDFIEILDQKNNRIAGLPVNNK